MIYFLILMISSTLFCAEEEILPNLPPEFEWITKEVYGSKRNYKYSKMVKKKRDKKLKTETENNCWICDFCEGQNTINGLGIKTCKYCGIVND